ncbi:MAG: hypothetical protein JWN86_3288 [Planctomycetota bacterium]|nr:hypothetical protein [Planctomycetota bacterium]
MSARRNTRALHPSIDSLESREVLSTLVAAPTTGGIHVKSVAVHAPVLPHGAGGIVSASRFLDCELYGKNCPKPPPPPVTTYSPGPGAKVGNYSSLNDDSLRFLVNTSLAKFTTTEASKAAASLAKLATNYGSRPTGNFFLTVGTNKSVLLFMQDLDTKQTGYVALKNAGSQGWFALTPNGKQFKIGEGSSQSFSSSFGGSKVGVVILNPTNSSVWNPGDIQYRFFVA